MDGRLGDEGTTTFDPHNVETRQRRLTGVDEIVLSPSAKCPSAGKIAAHFAGVFGARVSKDITSCITERSSGRCRVAEPAPGPRPDATEAVKSERIIHVLCQTADSLRPAWTTQRCCRSRVRGTRCR